MEHLYFKCFCQRPGCPFCAEPFGPYCVLCLGAEEELAMECPNKPLKQRQADGLREGGLEFAANTWIPSNVAPLF